MSDSVNHPKHYTSHPSGVECIQVTEHMSFNLGNAVKYLWRTEHKNGKEDLEKAIWYIQREIERLYPSPYENIAEEIFGKGERHARINIKYPETPPSGFTEAYFPHSSRNSAEGEESE